MNSRGTETTLAAKGGQRTESVFREKGDQLVGIGDGGERNGSRIIYESGIAKNFSDLSLGGWGRRRER